jgi:hypothetical protein
VQESAPVVSLAAGGLPQYPTADVTNPHMTPTFGKGRATALYGTPGNSVVGDMGNKLIGMPGVLNRHAAGGHIPEFYSEGGLNNRYVVGNGDGTSDDVPAMLANGEFVIPADVVSSLGNGSNDAGAHVLDEFLRTIRKHKRAADARHLPPDSKGALGYLLEAKRKVK